MSVFRMPKSMCTNGFPVSFRLRACPFLSRGSSDSDRCPRMSFEAFGMTLDISLGNLFRNTSLGVWCPLRSWHHFWAGWCPRLGGHRQWAPHKVTKYTSGHCHSMKVRLPINHIRRASSAFPLEIGKVTRRQSLAKEAQRLRDKAGRRGFRDIPACDNFDRVLNEMERESCAAEAFMNTQRDYGFPTRLRRATLSLALGGLFPAALKNSLSEEKLTP